MVESNASSWIKILRDAGADLGSVESQCLIEQAEVHSVQLEERPIQVPVAIRQKIGRTLRLAAYPQTHGRVHHTFKIYELTEGVSTTKEGRVGFACLQHHGGNIQLEIRAREVRARVRRCSQEILFNTQSVHIPMFDCVVCKRCSTRLVEPTINGIAIDNFHRYYDEEFWSFVDGAIGRPFERFVTPAEAPQHSCDLRYESTLQSMRHLLRERRKLNKLRKRRLFLNDGSEAVYIYLMLNRRNGLHKIGFTTNPHRRERTLQSEEPEVSLVWRILGLRQDETFLHALFASQRVRGEWFQLGPEDVAWIKSILQREELYSRNFPDHVD